METFTASSVMEEWVFPVLRTATPLVFASMGGLWCERSGVIQIGLEGFMLLGAFFGAFFALALKSVFLGFLGAGLIGAILGGVFGIAVIRFRANQIITGTAINLFAAGLTPILCKAVYGSANSSARVDFTEPLLWGPLVAAGLCAVVSWALFLWTPWGLRMRFAGEHPEALQNAGVSVVRYRWMGVVLAGVLASVGGAMLSVFLSSSFVRGMSAGRGFIALAALILGRWNPGLTVMGCFLFAFTDLMQGRLQGHEWFGIKVADPMVHTFPYAVTLFILAFVMGRSRAPKALGEPW